MLPQPVKDKDIPNKALSPAVVKLIPARPLFFIIIVATSLLDFRCLSYIYNYIKEG
ncbi:hypothetical protein D3C71_2056560 [compost metagenome]